MSIKFIVIIPTVINLILFVYVLTSFIVSTLNISLIEIFGLNILILIQIILFFFIWLPITMYSILFIVSDLCGDEEIVWTDGQLHLCQKHYDERKKDVE